jgi:asparagine synthase (glutamine-hydrolysing)
VSALNGLTPLEVASHVLTGADGAVRPPPRSRRTAIAALEESLRIALSSPPCLVAFSGGRDSSALLAVAARVARREGLPDPVPVTLRFAGAPDTDEEDWQSLLIAQLGSPDWVRLDFDDELDLVGPVARELMERDGLPYPYNLHLLVPLIEAARGGTLITGLGGDQALQPAGRALDVLARRARPEPRDVLRVAAAVGPRPVRRLALRKRAGLSFPWLAPDANARLGRAWLEDEVRRPFRWDRLLRAEWRARYMQLTARRLEGVGRHLGTSVRHPFAEAEFISALASGAGATGFASRTAAMDFLFGDALPHELIERPTKALFDDVLWNRHTRRFVAGIDEAALGHALTRLGLGGIVDPRALAAHWSGPNPVANSFLLLQACWLTTRARPPVAHDGERHPEPQPGRAA